MELLNDRVLIERIEQDDNILLTDRAKGIKGIVRAVGPGKWIEGYWQYGAARWEADSNGIHHAHCGSWEWVAGYRQPLDVKVGDKVLFNSKWNDFAAGENKGTGSDFSGPLERPLPLNASPMLHLVQEADIFAIVSHLDFTASAKPNSSEQSFMQNIEIKGPWNS